MFDTITAVVGVLTLFIGVATFILTELDKRRRATVVLMKGWQSDTIAYIIDEASAAGLAFDGVKAKYLAAAHQSKKYMPPSLLQDEEIRRTLFDLQSKGVIYRLDNNRYVCVRHQTHEALQAHVDQRLKENTNELMTRLEVMMESVQTRQIEVQGELQQRMSAQLGQFFDLMHEMKREQGAVQQSELVHREIQRAALEMAGRDPRRYNADQIAIDVMDKTKADRVVVMIQIISLLQNGILAQDDMGKVSIRLFQLPDAVLS